MSPREFAAAVTHTLRSSESSVQSIARVDGNGVLIRVTKASEGLVRRLQTTFPLATVALAEDLVGNDASAHVLFPSAEEQRAIAYNLARGLRSSKMLVVGSNIMLFLAVVCLIVSMANF